jgi:hypothetical protein
MPLTEQQIRNFRPKPGKKTRLFDARGLYLEISPTSGTYWRWKYHYGGKEIQCTGSRSIRQRTMWEGRHAERRHFVCD